MPEHRINGYYVAIPESTLQSNKWRMLKAYSRVVYQTMGLRYIRTGVNATGTVTWTQEELVEESGLPLCTVQRGTKELKKQGYVVVYEPGGRWQRGTTYLMVSKYMDG